MAQTQIKCTESDIFCSGVLDRSGAEALVAAIRERAIFTIDFADVTEVKFAAIRILMNESRSHRRICILNASDAVAARFDDTGVSFYVNVCRKPGQLKVGNYDEFGAGYLSKAYNSTDGDSVMKVYGPRVSRRLIVQEKTIARAVMLFGIPTPLVGSMYEDAENTAIDFERIEGKRSFSRIVSEQPERMEEMSVKFAQMCKRLHSTECDTGMFPDRTHFYRRAVAAGPGLTDAERATVLAFLDSVPPATTCLHGDMQMSNVITNGKEDMWIDLSDFGYGNPMLDMGMWYFLCRLTSEENSQHVFHLGRAQMAQIWNIFAREYFGADTPEKLADVDRRVQPYAALHMLYLGITYGFEPGMMDFVRKTILSGC